MVSYAKYSLVPTEEPKEAIEPKDIKTAAFDYSSAFNYKSAFDYSSNNPSQYQSIYDYGYGGPKHSISLGVGENDKKKKREAFTIMRCITDIAVVVSYLFIGITFPCTLLFCFKKLQQWERLIVFRVGHLRGVLGPGIVFIIPWLDKYTRIDMRTKAFSVPPQQLITSDNGIIEMGCEVKYRVSDVQQLTTTVTTPQHGLRSFGKTVMLNVLTKHTVREMEKDRLLISSEILRELNARVYNWGIEIGEVELSTVNVLKEPEPNNLLKPLFNALGNIGQGGSTDVAFAPGLPTPASDGVPPMFDFSSLGNLAKMSGFPGFSQDTKKSKTEKPSDGGLDYMNSDLIQLLSETTNIKQRSYQAMDAEDSRGNLPKSKFGKYLQQLVTARGGEDLNHGIYRLQVEGKDTGVYIIFIANGIRQVVEGDLPQVTPDVSVTVSKEDLIAVLEGSLPPLQAYLSGKLTVHGNIQLLMGLECLRQANMPRDSEADDIFVV